MTKDEKKKTLTQEELSDIICETSDQISKLMEEKFEWFKAQDICGKHFITYVLNVILCGINDYVLNSQKILQVVSKEMIITDVIIAICEQHGIQFVRENEAATTTH